METIQEETHLKFTKKQRQSIINFELETENGLNDLFSVIINGLMLSERKLFLENKEDTANKGNGYRKATRLSNGCKV